jgi:hypothetical protein
VDGMTWRQYGEDLERKLADLHARIHRGAYRAQLPRPTTPENHRWRSRVAEPAVVLTFGSRFPVISDT